MVRRTGRPVGPAKALLVAVLCIGVAGVSHGAPSDVFTSPAPEVGGEPPKGRELATSDASVSTKTGALEYQYPITVPPGRLGVEPSLALSYSSQGSLYGGIAAHWSLELPTIRVDPSQDYLERFQLGSTTGTAETFYVSSLAGGHRLVEVSEPSGVAPDVIAQYRPQRDESYARYDQLSLSEWRVLTTDGSKLEFRAMATPSAPSHAGPFHLVASEDLFGNRIEYVYEIPSTLGTTHPRIARIDYTSNTNGPSGPIEPHARVVFDYDDAVFCPGDSLPAGASSSVRQGFQSYSGQWPLRAIRTEVRTAPGGSYRPVRRVDLTYDHHCSSTSGPARYLTSIQESAQSPGGITTTMPPVTFGYGVKDPSFVSTGSTGTTTANGDRSLAGKWSPTITDTLLDLDGDGRLDRLSVADASTCKFEWKRGGSSAPAQPIELTDGITASPYFPKIPWNDGTTGTAGYGERCSLTGQYSRATNRAPDGSCSDTHLGNYLYYRFLDIDADGLPDLVTAIQSDYRYYETLEDPYFQAEYDGLGPYDPHAGGACPLVDPAKVASFEECDRYGRCGFNQQQLREYLSTVDHLACGTVLFKQKSPEARQLHNESILDPIFPSDPADPDSCEDRIREPEEHNGRYLWRWHRNLGDGQFASDHILIKSPVQLDSARGDSSVGSAQGGFSSSNHSIIDINGDGYLDAVVTKWGAQDEDRKFWKVFLGDGQGNFTGDPLDPDGGPYFWYAPEDAVPSGSTVYGDSTWTDGWLEVGSSLVDVNGDGLPDLVTRRQGATEPQVFLNFGGGFRLGNVPDLADPLVQSGSGEELAGYTYYSDLVYDTRQEGIATGTSTGQLRFTDLDQDGRVDIVNYRDLSGPPGARLRAPHVYIGNGSPTLRSPAFATGFPPLSPETRVDSTLRWHVTRDFVDLDGDGLKEIVESPLYGGTNRYYEQSLELGEAPRLLRSIDNGAGLTTDVEYAPLSVATSGMPSHMWLVTKLRRSESLASTTFSNAPPSVTSYEYVDPVWNADLQGKHGFRGFSQVRTKTPSGGLVAETFDYQVDWSGRLSERTTYLDDTETQATSVRKLHWLEYDMLGGTSTIVLYRTDDYTCRAGENRDMCLDSVDRRVRRQTHHYYRFSVSPSSECVAMSARRDFDYRNLAKTPGDRMTEYTKVLDAGPSVHRIRTTAEELKSWDGEVYQLAGRTQYEWDGRQLYVQARIESISATEKRRWEFGVDIDTGLKQWEKKPDQVERASSARTDYVYDDFFLHPAVTTNELGHAVETVHDPGTGALEEQWGPNVKGKKVCTISGCSYQELGKEGFVIAVDGFGRPLEKRVNIDDATDGYTLVLAQTWQYFDSELPQRMVERRLLDFGGTIFIQSESWHDGYGRLKGTRALTASSAAETRYDYDAAGNLARFETPDPRTEKGPETVEFRYRYDSIGRPLGFRVPGKDGLAPDPVDSAAWAAGVGLDLEHDGLTSTRREVVTDGGPIAETVLTKDVWSRLIEVEEKLDNGTYALTTYGYDVRDAMTEVIDPEGLKTSIDYDWLGNRTKISRAGRTWQYGYDLNGNLVTEVAPRPAKALAIDYTTSIAYDDLDRPTSRWTGARALSGEQQALYGTGPSALVSFDYDKGENGIGRLTSVAGEVLTAAFEYDALGQLKAETRGFDLEDELGLGLADTRTSYTTYDALGHAKTRQLADGTQSTSTQLSYTYDPYRGLPESVTWTQTGEVIAKLSRTTAGAAHERIGGPSSCVSRTWTRDELGRTVGTEVYNGCGASPTVPTFDELYTYFDSGDVDTLDVGRMGITPQVRSFDFHYDTRHQLKTAIASDYSASLDYGDAGRLVAAEISAPPGALTSRSRKVSYEYDVPGGFADREAVDQLFETGRGMPLVNYAYDESGNVVVREDADEGTFEFVYDGQDQQREAVSPDGSRELYYYDHDGQRRLAVKRFASGQVDRIRFWHGDTEIWYDGSGTEAKTWAHVSLGARTVARIENRSSLEQQFVNELGNLMGALTSSLRGVEVAYVYGPFGDIIDQVGTTEAHLRRFNGKEHDQLSGLSYYGYRYYDPLSLTWTQADPLYRFVPDLAYDEPRRMNLYAFTANNPLRFIDPDGLQIMGIPEGATGVGGGQESIVLPRADGGHTVMDAGTTTSWGGREAFNSMSAEGQSQWIEDDANSLWGAPMMAAITSTGGGGRRDRNGRQAGGRGVTAGRAGNNPIGKAKARLAEKIEGIQTSRHARREAMRQNNTPTSRAVTSQTGRSGRRQTVVEGSDGRPRVQTQHPPDKKHDKPHWHDAPAKIDPDTGKPRVNDHGQIKDSNESRSTVEYAH